MIYSLTIADRFHEATISGASHEIRAEVFRECFDPGVYACSYAMITLLINPLAEEVTAKCTMAEARAAAYDRTCAETTRRRKADAAHRKSLR